MFYKGQEEREQVRRGVFNVLEHEPKTLFSSNCQRALFEYEFACLAADISAYEILGIKRLFTGNYDHLLLLVVSPIV